MGLAAPSGIKINCWRAREDTDRTPCPLGHDLIGANLVDGKCRACSWARSIVRAARAAGDVVLEGDMVMYADECFAALREA